MDNTFSRLEDELECLTMKLKQQNLLTDEKVKSAEFLDVLNESPYLLTLHSIDSYRPVMLNNKMKDFYGFTSNYLKGMNYMYYLNTIHTSTYTSLIKSLTFFRKDVDKSLHLHYKLLYKRKDWKFVIGTTQTIVRKPNGKPWYALTLAMEHKTVSVLGIDTKLKELTEREREILLLIRKNFSKPKIANVLGISEHTTQTHIKKILKKLHVSKVSDLIVEDSAYLTPGLNFDKLTNREKEIIALLGIGLSKKEISACLNISEHTVQTHTKKIFNKLNISKSF